MRETERGGGLARNVSITAADMMAVPLIPESATDDDASKSTALTSQSCRGCSSLCMSALSFRERRRFFTL